MTGGLGSGTKEAPRTGTEGEKIWSYNEHCTNSLSDSYTHLEMNTTYHHSLTTCKCTGLLVLVWFLAVTLQKYSPSDPFLTFRGNVIGPFFVARISSLPFISSKVTGDGESDSLHSNFTVDLRKAILGPVSSGLRVDPSAHNTEIENDVTALTILYCITIL